MRVLNYIAYAIVLTMAEAATAQGVTAPVNRPPLVINSAVDPMESEAPPSVDFKQYLQLVQKNNLILAAQKAQIDIADAQIALAALFPDPTFTTGLAAYEMSKDKLPVISTFGVNFTIEGGRKREVRTDAARAEKARAEADFVRQIVVVQLDAANAYIDHLRAKAMQQSWKAALMLLERLEQHSQNRRDKPDVVSQVQLRAEKLHAQAELDAATADIYIASRAMLTFVQSGTADMKRQFDGSGSLEIAALNDYQATVRDGTREDVVAAQKALEAASRREDLSRENRSLDLNFNLGVNHSRAGEYLNTPLPQSNSLIALLTIPIPFSLRQDGDLRAASAATTQAMKQYQDLLQRSGLEAEQARARYAAALSQMQKYSASSEMTANTLRSHAELYFANKSELSDVILLIKLNNESNTFKIEAQAGHARSMAVLLSQARKLQAMRYGNT